MDPLDDKHIERTSHTSHRFFAVLAVRNQLGNQRIVVRRHNALGVLRRIHANAIATRNIKDRESCPPTA